MTGLKTFENGMQRLQCYHSSVTFCIFKFLYSSPELYIIFWTRNIFCRTFFHNYFLLLGCSFPSLFHETLLHTQCSTQISPPLKSVPSAVSSKHSISNIYQICSTKQSSLFIYSPLCMCHPSS